MTPQEQRLEQAHQDLQAAAATMSPEEAAGALSCVASHAVQMVELHPELSENCPPLTGLLTSVLMLGPRMVPDGKLNHSGCAAFLATLNRLQRATYTPEVGP